MYVSFFLLVSLFKYFEVKFIAGLAWDWLNQKLYWADHCDDDIEVYDPSTQVRRVLFDSGLVQPHALVVDPTTGYEKCTVMLHVHVFTCIVCGMFMVCVYTISM